MSQELRFVLDFKTADTVLVGVYFEDGLNEVIDVALGIDAAGDGEPKELMLRIFSEHHGPDLDGANSGVPI